MDQKLIYPTAYDFFVEVLNSIDKENISTILRPYSISAEEAIFTIFNSYESNNLAPVSISRMGDYCEFGGNNNFFYMHLFLKNYENKIVLINETPYLVQEDPEDCGWYNFYTV